MIRHIVMFRLKEEAEGADKSENAAKIKQILEKLPPEIEEIKFYQVGVNFADSPAASDLVLVSDFASVEELNSYRGHPKHVQALEFIKKVVSETRVADIEY